MSWYKKAQQVAPISILSYIPEYGELSISFNGRKKYIYPGVSPYIYDKIRTLLKYKNYREVQKILKNLSTNQPKIGLDTEEDKQQILDQLYDEGYLS